MRRWSYENENNKSLFTGSQGATLVQQAANNTKQQFANSPDLSHELMNAIMDALAAHSTMSKQALESGWLKRYSARAWAAL